MRTSHSHVVPADCLLVSYLETYLEQFRALAMGLEDRDERLQEHRDYETCPRVTTRKALTVS